MNRADVDTESGDGSTSEARGATSGRRPVRKAVGTGRRALGSGAAAGVGGGLLLLRGVRSLRRGARVRGLGLFLAGGLFVVLARRQRRAGAVDETDVVDTGPDLEAGATGSAGDSGPSATGEEAETVVDTGPDVENAGSGTDSDDEAESTSVVETDVVNAGVEGDLDDADPRTDGADYGTPDRMGEAAFDGQSGRVPVPQRAFNQNLLSLGAEAFWGVREGDPAVIVSGTYDAIEDRDGVRYVASSEIDDDRGLFIPDTVRNHWDGVAGGGDAVTAGDGVVFAITDERRAQELILVVPERWSDDVLGGA